MAASANKPVTLCTHAAAIGGHLTQLDGRSSCLSDSGVDTWSMLALQATIILVTCEVHSRTPR